MINAIVFASNWELLNRHFRHNCGEQVMAIYYQYLSPRLTTEEFVGAVETILIEENYFPPATLILEKVFGTPEARAYADWEVILEAAKRGEAPYLSSEGQRALDAVGGRYVIERADIHKDLPWLRRDFIKAFKTQEEISHKKELEGWRNQAQKMLGDSDG